MTPFPIRDVRRQFPALQHAPDWIPFDNAAGAQVPAGVLDAVQDHLVRRNVQRGGRYRQSREVDAVIQQARESVAIFLNARATGEVAFGMNATSFIRAVSQSIGQSLADRREIVVTELDHEANIATWLALESMGATIRWWRATPGARLDPADLDAQLSPRTRLVACPLASNATGTIVDVGEVTARAHAVGAEVFVDAVHFGPHAPVDVQALDCDYLVCSGYKIFAPHMGFLWGRREALERLTTFREYFIPDEVPAKLEVGTYVYENVAGMQAAIHYLESLGGGSSDGSSRPEESPSPGAQDAASRRQVLVRGMDAIRQYEAELSRALLALPERVDGMRIYGVTDAAQTTERTPTLLFTLDRTAPGEITDRLAAQGIAVRDGHMYAPRLIRRMGLSEETGAVRASLVHYNTIEEIERFGEALEAL